MPKATHNQGIVQCSKGVGGDEMSITIENKAPFCRYGNIVINKVYVHSVDIGFGEVIMEGGLRLKFPSEVVKRWFADIADDSETIEAAKAEVEEKK